MLPAPSPLPGKPRITKIIIPHAFPQPKSPHFPSLRGQGPLGLWLLSAPFFPKRLKSRKNRFKVFSTCLSSDGRARARRHPIAVVQKGVSLEKSWFVTVETRPHPL